MTPLASNGSGGSQEMVMKEGDLFTAVILVGGPEGTKSGRGMHLL